MAYQNPDYNPDWKTVHDRHAPKREQAMETMRPLEAEGGTDSDVYRRAGAAHSAHNDACIAAILSQFETVQDYARWRSEGWQLPYGYDCSIPIPHLDIEGFLTIDEASHAFSKASDEIQDAAHTKRHRQPISQPEGLIAFADAKSPGLTRYWREFSPRDLYPQGCTVSSAIRILMTVYQIEDCWHVCFMQDWDSPGISVTNAISSLATAFLREANAIAEQQMQHVGKTGLRARFARWTKHEHAQLLDPDKFYFYEHNPPTAHLKEDFARVILHFENDEYRNPEWVHFKTIPAVIQSARDYLRELDDAGRPAHQSPMIGGPGHKPA